MLLWPQTWTLFFKISMKRRETGVPGGKPSSRNILFNFVRFAILKCSRFKYKIEPWMCNPLCRLAGALGCTSISILLHLAFINRYCCTQTWWIMPLFKLITTLIIQWILARFLIVVLVAMGVILILILINITSNSLSLPYMVMLHC